MITSATVVVHRHRAWWRDIARSYRILLDDQFVGTVRNGKAATFAVTPGHHRVQARIDWTGSPVVEIEPTADVEIHLDLRPAGTVFGVYWRVFTRTKWLSLRILPGSRADEPRSPLDAIGFIR
jgi:hypothetical protein